MQDAKNIVIKNEQIAIIAKHKTSFIPVSKAIK